MSNVATPLRTTDSPESNPCRSRSPVGGRARPSSKRSRDSEAGNVSMMAPVMTASSDSSRKGRLTSCSTNPCTSLSTVEIAWARGLPENPPSRKHRIPVSSSRRVAGLGLVLDAIRLTAHGCRRRTCRVWCARWLTVCRHSADGSGSSISAATTSTRPSRISSFPATWWSARRPRSPAACEATHGDRLDPLAVGDGQGDLQCPVPVHRRPVRHLGRPTAHGPLPLVSLGHWTT